MGFASDSSQDITVGHDNNVVFGSRSKVLAHPLRSLEERDIVSGVEALLARPVWGKMRKVETLHFGVFFQDCSRRAGIAWEIIAFLQLRQYNDFAKSAKSFNGRSIPDLGALQRPLQTGRQDDFGLCLQVWGQSGKTCRLLLAQRCQRRIWNGVVICDILG